MLDRLAATPLPPRMQILDRDARGYPIPFAVLRDDDGRPHFTINDHRKAALCLRDDLCAICGGRLSRGRWFLGGAGSAFHPNGVYFDPPGHGECIRYAAQVCPYIALRKYDGRIDDKTLAPDKLPGGLLLIDPTIDPRRPQIFVAVMARGQKILGDHVKPTRPYIAIELWRHGENITTPALVARLKRDWNEAFDDA